MNKFYARFTLTLTHFLDFLIGGGRSKNEFEKEIKIRTRNIYGTKILLSILLIVHLSQLLYFPQAPGVAGVSVSWRWYLCFAESACFNENC